jgi:hypothetical protein
MELKWEEFHNIDKLASVQHEINGLSAIYIWGWLDSEGKFVPYYIGKAHNLANRLFDHIGNLKGGRYGIYSFQYARSPGFQPLYQQDNEKMIYMPSDLNNWRNVFLSQNVQDNLNLLLKELWFTWCKTDKMFNVDLERLIYKQLKMKTGKVAASVRGEAGLSFTDIHFSGNDALVKLCNND